MNVALCGTHGIGKTTLLQDVWSRLASTDPEGWLGTKLTEQARSVAAALELHSLADVPLWSQQQREYFQWRVMMNQVAAEHQAVLEHGGFLSDRSVVDNLSYIMYYRCSQTMINAIKAFCMSHVEHYDILFYMPIPVQFNVDALHDGFRMEQLESVVAVDEIMLGLFEDIGESTNIVTLSADRNAWVDEVCEEIDIFSLTSV